MKLYDSIRGMDDCDAWDEYDRCYSTLKLTEGRLKDALDERDEALHDARELAAMYLQCLNSRALERGETVEQVAAFCEQEFAENPWLKEEYERLSTQEARVRAFCQEWKLK